MHGFVVGLFQMQPEKAGVSEAYSPIKQYVLGFGSFSCHQLGGSWGSLDRHCLLKPVLHHAAQTQGKAVLV